MVSHSWSHVKSRFLQEILFLSFLLSYSYISFTNLSLYFCSSGYNPHPPKKYCILYTVFNFSGLNVRVWHLHFKAVSVNSQHLVKGALSACETHHPQAVKTKESHQKESRREKEKNTSASQHKRLSTERSGVDDCRIICPVCLVESSSTIKKNPFTTLSQVKNTQ